MNVSEIIEEIRKAGWDQAEMARRFHVAQSTISKWKNRKQSPVLDQWERVTAFIRSEPKLQHLRYMADSGIAPVMGRIGAGSTIGHEQIPPGGLYSVTLPYPIPADMLAFVVDGEAMYPQFDPGEVIVVYKEQRQDTINYIGQLVVVQLRDGRRYLKKLYPGSAPDLYRLESFNAVPIQDADIDWIGEIFDKVPAHSVFKADHPKVRPATRSARR